MPRIDRILQVTRLIRLFRFPEGGKVSEPEDGDREPRRGVWRHGGRGLLVVALKPARSRQVRDLELECVYNTRSKMELYST